MTTAQIESLFIVNALPRPDNRDRQLLESTAQNYDALIFGDVASHFAERFDGAVMSVHARAVFAYKRGRAPSPAPTPVWQRRTARKKK